VAAFDRNGHGLRQQVAVALDVPRMCRGIGPEAQRPHERVVEPGADLCLVGARLAPDLCAPGIYIRDLVETVDDLAARQQLAVVIAAVDTRDEALDASSDVDGIAHGLPHPMMPDPRPDTGVCRAATALKRQTGGSGRI
jgi:hypothetical protein